jgi:predicted AAA+ superfamily ATPase
MLKMKERYLFQYVMSDLSEKMVFLGGPRQVGKTHLSKEIGRRFASGYAYLNWDDDDDRTAILSKNFPRSGLLILDELHKNRKWRQLLKGLYDKNKDVMQIMVTGSARLDYYRFGGDSLQGRYHYLRLHPLSVKELGITSQSDLLTLLQLGGFPEPFFSGSETKARRWSRSYRQRLIREDLAALEKTEDLARIELMAMRLPDLVKSPLSINALREDLQVSHVTAAKWFQILERLYHVFRVTPFGSPKLKAVKKEFKHFHYDWSLVTDPGARCENFIGSHLLKWCHFVEDTEGYDMDLRYFRDREQREVDFVILKNQKPILFCEVKSHDKTFSPHLRYLKMKFPQVRAIQINLNPVQHTISADGLELISALDFLQELPV